MALKIVISGIFLALVVAAAGCGGSDSNGAGDTGGGGEVADQAQNVVEFSHTSFSPAELTVIAGDKVVFRNLVTMSHPLVNEEVGLDTGEFTLGERSFTFDEPGMFTITNTAHGTSMVVVVQGNDY